MNRKISFINMEHSNPMENHINEKLNKIDEILKGEEWSTPMHLEFWLKANALHPHHAAELHLKTPQFNLNAHDEGTDMYIVIDNTIDKMVKLLKKEKAKKIDKRDKVETDKTEFEDDKFTL